MQNDNELIPTRDSLLTRLKDWNDQESWKVFFDTYWKLIYHAGIKAGLTDAEAQDVVQETVLSVLKSMPEFRYDAEKGSFKGWLLRLTSWRITDQLRKRQKGIDYAKREKRTSSETATIDRVADPVGPGIAAVWEDEWERNLFDAAIERVKKKVDPKHYQVFDLCVFKKWPISKVAQILGLSAGRIYLVKHRINNLVKKEVSYLQTKPI